jgi:hypothetical protein
MIQNVLKLAQEIRLTCGNCAYFHTPKCGRSPILYTDYPCNDGLLIQLFKSDVLIKQGTTSLIKPIRFLSSTKTKNELLQNFDLSDQELEDLILHIKLRTTQQQDKPKEKQPKQEPELSEEQKETATALLKDPEIITKFLSHQNRFLIMDETVRKLILLTCCSTYGDYPLNLSLQQVFSAGKTTTTVQTCKYFPNVWLLGAMSPKSLIHERGEPTEEQDGYVIDLQKRILVFLDEPQLETLAMLKPLLSHDTFETTYKFVDKQSGETVKAILRGWPSVIFCTTKSRYIMEFSSRWLTASPQTSTDKIQQVIKAKGEKAAQTQQPDPEFETWQTAFKLLSKEAPLKVIVPYANELAQCFRTKKPIDMRFFDLFLALIKATTILHALQREKNGNGNLKATIQDYEEAYQVFHEIERSTTLGLGQNVIDFYNNIVLPLWTETQETTNGNTPIQTFDGKPTDKHLTTPLTYESIMQAYQETAEETISRSTLRETYLKPLEQKGLIDFEDDTTDKRKKIITVKSTIPNQSLINDVEFKRIIAERVG